MKKSIEITCDSTSETERIGGKIHEQLVGNQDYIHCRIFLLVDSYNCKIHYDVMDDSETNPELTI